MRVKEPNQKIKSQLATRFKLIPRLKDVGFHVHGSWFMVHRFNQQSTINGRCFLPSLKA